MSRPIVGSVIGFALRWDGQEHGVLWISGDTVLYDGVRQVADRLQVATALELCRLVQPRTVIPIHYEGWKHFREGRQAIERELATRPEALRDRIRWLPIGVATKVDV